MRKLFAVMLAAVFVSPALAQGDAKAVIEKAIKAHGGKEALDKYPASKTKFKGEMSIQGLDMTFEGSGASGPNQMKMELNADVAGQKLSLMQMVDGDKVKVKASLGGMALPQPEDDNAKDELKFALVNQDISQLTPLLKNDKKYTLKAEAGEDVDGKKANVVSVTAKIAGDKTKDVKLYFDAESGLLVKFARKGIAPGSADGKESLQETVLSDYKKVESGLMIAMKTVNYSEGKKFMTMTTTEYKSLEKLDPKDMKADD